MRMLACGMWMTRMRTSSSKRRYAVSLPQNVVTTTQHAFSTEHGLTTAEAVTIAHQLVNREKTKTELMNDGFNRYSLNHKDGLPEWFLDDEAKHYKANIPVTKEAIAALRAKLRALDARPIKKIAEAKARKKMKAAMKLDKAMKKAEGVNEAADMTESAKARQIEKLMKKGMSTKNKKEVKVVVAKGANKGVKGRPKGVKGRYLMVDPRMRKEASVHSFGHCAIPILTALKDAREETERKGEQKTQADLISTLVWRYHCYCVCWRDVHLCLSCP